MIDDYKQCNVLCTIERSTTPLISSVPIDEYVQMVDKNFDYDFTGESKFYPYILPKCLDDIDYDILVITGASGSGKSTLLKNFSFFDKPKKEFDNTKAIVSNFDTPDDACERLSAVGLNSMPVWCRPRNVLSVGEGFRADLALNINSNTVFDEFTSTIDRNVAKSTCHSISKYIKNKKMHHIVFCSCHNDYIEYLNPDIVIDLNEEKIYDCRDVDLGKTLLSTFTNRPTRACGEYLGDITI